MDLNHLQRAISVALTLLITISFIGGDLALATSIDKPIDKQTDSRQALAMNAAQGGSANIMEAVTPPIRIDLTTKHDAPMVEKYLLDGKLAVGETALIARLKAHSKDDQARFGLGVLQFLQAVERLGQDLYHYGLRDYSSEGPVVPGMKFQIASNPQPARISYMQLQQVIPDIRRQADDG